MPKKKVISKEEFIEVDVVSSEIAEPKKKSKTKSVVKDTGFNQLLKIAAPNKQEREGFAEDVVLRITEGLINPIDVHLQLKNMESVLKLVNEDPEYKRLLLAEVQKNIGENKKYNYFGSDFSTSETGVKYDYSECKDPEIKKLHSEQKELDKKVKEREKFLQALSKEGIEVLFEDELIRIFPPSKSSTTSVAVKLS